MEAVRWHELFVPSLSPFEVVLRAALAYGAVQVVFRIAGRKELGRYSTFNVAVLFLIATAMRQSIVGEDVSLTSAAVGLATIVTLDTLLSRLAFGSERAATLIEGPVRQLIRDGRLLEDQMRHARIARHELAAHLREKGRESLDDVMHAYLERSGRISFIFKKES